MSKHKPLPPLEEVQELINYDPATGQFTWIKTGKSTGLPNARNRCQIHLDDGIYQAPRVAWYLSHGEDPGNQQVDHIDRNPANNKINNLRLLTNQKNQFNRDVKGITYLPKRNKWRARIKVDRKQILIGDYDCPLLAHLAYKDAKAQYHII